MVSTPERIDGHRLGPRYFMEFALDCEIGRIAVRGWVEEVRRRGADKFASPDMMAQLERTLDQLDREGMNVYSAPTIRREFR